MGNAFGKKKTKLKSSKLKTVYVCPSDTEHFGNVNIENITETWLNTTRVSSRTTNLESHHTCKPHTEVARRYEAAQRLASVSQVNTQSNSPLKGNCSVYHTNSVSSASLRTPVVLPKPSPKPPIHFAGITTASPKSSLTANRPSVSNEGSIRKSITNSVSLAPVRTTAVRPFTLAAAQPVLSPTKPKRIRISSIKSKKKNSITSKAKRISTVGLTNSGTSVKNATINSRNQKTKFSFKLYEPRRPTRKLFNNNFTSLDLTTSNKYHPIRLIDELEINSNQLTEQNYLDVLLLFADIEDLHCEDAILVYNRNFEKIEYSVTGNYIINVPNLNDSRPSISVHSRLTIHSNQLENAKPIYGTILEIQPKHIEVGFKDTIDTDIWYDVKFLSNRTTFRMEKLAIELMRQKNLVPFMFPNPDKVRSSNAHYTDQHFTWFNKSVAKNLEQQTVIENIYHGTSYPYPYILFGPPGTGKTTTLVESILQLWKNKIDTRILIVSTSNFACNVISKRLLDFLPETEIFRLFSKSQEVVVDKIDTHVLKASNLETKTHYNPKPYELYPYRVIVATLTASGRLIQDGFKTDHFTHLFIDECGSCTEGSSLIPIAGLISSRNKITANIILAGDPLQLGPVIQSKYAENLGYDVSMIERLMEFPLYKKDECIGDYNNKCITKLRCNYRSHKDILHISNQLFYDSELKALGSKDVTNRIINWRNLPNPKFPILFEAVFGKSLHENDSPSLYNKHEIKVVISYLKLLVNKNINGKVIRQSDIGVITPYRKQNQKIRALCDQLKWNDIEVASVEAFQGNEKSVIIFSTVRSKVDSMGFLSSERRLNVALTRAQAGLIIIGDPKVLMKDKCWYQLLKFCYDNNAICGESFNFYDSL